MEQLNLEHGNWLVVSCGNMPSKINCKLVIMAPEGQREDLLDAAVAHAVKSHEHEESEELRSEINKKIERITV